MFTVLVNSKATNLDQNLDPIDGPSLSLKVHPGNFVLDLEFDLIPRTCTHVSRTV